MARGFYDRPYIAAGYNNQENMQPLYKLGINPNTNLPYFNEYKGDNTLVLVRFFQNEGTQRNGNRRQVPIGLPRAQWEFPALSNDDYNFLADTFAINRLDGEVTIHTENFESNTWSTYNAIMDINQQDRSTAWNGFEWRPFIIDFIDLRIIT